MASSGDPLRNEVAGDSPCPSPSKVGTSVAMAAGWCSKLLSYWMTTYSPAGAPGRVLVYAAVLTCATVSCRGVRFDPTCFATGLWGRSPCTIAQAASELSAYFPESTMANHASLDVWASFSGVCWASTRTEADSRRLIQSGDANFVGFAPL